MSNIAGIVIINKDGSFAVASSKLIKVVEDELYGEVDEK